MADGKADAAQIERLRLAFRSADAGSNDGKLSFEEFYTLLKRGNPKFQEEQAEVLFENCDQDLSGGIDFDEFVEYIFNNADMVNVFKLETTAEEEDCKTTLMSMPGPIRAAASKAVKERGEDWRKMTWKERLEEVKEIEKGNREGTDVRAKAAPVFDPSSTVKVMPRKADRPRTGTTSPKSPAKDPLNSTMSRTIRSRSDQEAVSGPVTTPVASPSSASKLSNKKFTIADMNQEELVNYSLQEDDLSFAGDAQSKAQCREFKKYLLTAGSPLDALEIERFIAKGTAGWVFLCTDKTSGKKCAMKMIRMTQARSGIKEWFCSKALRGISEDVVFTSEKVHVVSRSSAPAVIQNELANAGPVNYFLCMIQELMPWGTLEDLAKEGELSPEIMFKCLEDVATTLAVMHANKIQHRDVKPENIMLQMDDENDDGQETVTSAKLCDFGSAQIGNDSNSCWDDIRRFGVTLFSVATGEGWTKNRLIRAKHDELVSRLTTAVADSSDPTMKRLPKVLEQILGGSMKMADVAKVMAEMADAYDD